MLAANILIVVAIVLILATVRDTVRRGGRLGPAGRTWLVVAVIFIAVTIFLRVGHR